MINDKVLNECFTNHAYHETKKNFRHIKIKSSHEIRGNIETIDCLIGQTRQKNF